MRSRSASAATAPAGPSSRDRRFPRVERPDEVVQLRPEAYEANVGLGVVLRDGANALGGLLDAPVDEDAVAVGKRHEVEGVVGNQLETVPVEPEVPVDRLLRELEQLDCPGLNVSSGSSGISASLVPHPPRVARRSTTSVFALAGAR